MCALKWAAAAHGHATVNPNCTRVTLTDSAVNVTFYREWQHFCFISVRSFLLLLLIARDKTSEWSYTCVWLHIWESPAYWLSALNHRTRPLLEFESESCFQCLINHLVVNHTRAFLSGLFVSRPNAEDNGGLHWACALPPPLTYNINQLRVVVVCPARLKRASGRFSGLLTERLLSGTSGEWVGQHKQIKQILLFTSRNESVMASSVAQGKPHCHHDDYFPKRNITGVWEE